MVIGGNHGLSGLRVMVQEMPLAVGGEAAMPWWSLGVVFGFAGTVVIMTYLHPNLAKVAAAYDEIFLRYQRGQLKAAEAEAAIGRLAARDDEGVIWTIHPKTGAWQRRTAGGATIEGTPPSFGFATPTPAEVSSGLDPLGARILLHDVEAGGSRDSLSGSTRRVTPARTARRRRINWAWIIAIVAVVVTVLTLT